MLELLTPHRTVPRSNSNIVALQAYTLYYHLSITLQVCSGAIGTHGNTLQFRFRVSIMHKLSLQVRSTGSVAQVFALRDRCMVADACFITLQVRSRGINAHVTVPKSPSNHTVNLNVRHKGSDTDTIMRQIRSGDSDFPYLHAITNRSRM